MDPSMIPYYNLGNIPQSYQHEPRFVVPWRIVTTPLLALKQYSMMKHIHPPEKGISSVEQFLKSEIKSRRIQPYSGIGFAILSEDMLNVARWDNQYPIVLKNDIYIYERENIKTATLADIRETGVFCIWELGIVSHERNAWKRFLASRHTEQDKKRYLEDFTAGPLS